MSGVGFRRFSLRQVQHVEDRVEPGFHALLRRLDLARLAVQHVVDPVPDLLTVAVGHAEDLADHLDRERPGEVGGQVERRLADERVQVAS